MMCSRTGICVTEFLCLYVAKPMCSAPGEGVRDQLGGDGCKISELIIRMAISHAKSEDFVVPVS